jgi:TPR repeat protein
LNTEPSRAEALLTLSAEQGYEEAQFAKAMLCMRDGDGHKKDAVEALQWYKRAAAQGLSAAL